MDSGSGTWGTTGAVKPVAEEPEYHSTAIQDGLQEMRAGFLDVVAFWQTFQLLWKQPELAIYDPQKRLKVTPLTFSVQAVVLLYLITGAAGLVADAFLDIPSWDAVGYRREVKRLDETLVAARTPEEKAAARQAEHRYELTVKANALASNAAKAATAPAYLAGAWFFGWFLRRWREKYPRIAAADRAFLYDFTKRIFVPSAVMMIGYALFLLFDRCLPEGMGTRQKALLSLIPGLLCMVGMVWGFGSYFVSCRQLIALFGIPRYAWRKGEGDNRAHRAVATGFLVAICLISATAVLVQLMVSSGYLMIRQGLIENIILRRANDYGR